MPPLLERSAQATAPPAPSELAELARHYGPLVFRSAYRVLGDVSLAEDVQQEVFLRIIESRREDVDSWPAYLATTSTRIAIDLLRRQQRWWRLLPQWKAQAPVEAASAEHAAVEAQRAQRLRVAMAGLSRREAQCFALRYLDGLDVGDIATALQLKENNVSVILHRARRRLAAQLGDTPEENQQ